MFKFAPNAGRLFLLVFLILCLGVPAIAQTDSTHLVKYTPEFRFREGVYMNFDQVRNNNPVPKSGIITTVAYDDPDYYEKVLQEKKLQVYDNLGTRQEASTQNIWGFARNGVLYIHLNDGYFRITIVGNICHFVASLTTFSNAYNPYSPYYNSYAYPYYSYPYSPYYSPYSNNTNTEMRQYLLDFKTGNILDYDENSVAVLLMADPELHDEYQTLSNKKQKQMKFLYIRKFNQRNPLYIPKN